jgi:hypothetical protein
VLRFTSPVSRKRRELGLGLVSRDSLQAAGETLVAARVAAEDARRLICDGVDPIEARDAKRAEARAQAANAATKSAATTLRRFARNYHDEHVEPLRSNRHAQQWINSIESRRRSWNGHRGKAKRSALDRTVSSHHPQGGLSPVAGVQ